MGEPDLRLTAIARRALDFVCADSVVGLGTGHAAAEFIRALGERVRAGLRVRGIATSEGSATLAREAGIPLTTLDEVEAIDVDVDGADEVDPQGNLIKGLGGALVREKIVAAASRKVVILVGEEKLVPKLGSHGKLPVEVVPFGFATCRRALARLGMTPRPRLCDGKLFVSDNGNHILDCDVAPLERLTELDRALHGIPGVVETGLFLDLAHVVLVQRGTHVEVREWSRA